MAWKCIILYQANMTEINHAKGESVLIRPTAINADQKALGKRAE